MFSSVKSRLNLLALVPLIIFFSATFFLFQFHVRQIVVKDYLNHLSGVLEVKAHTIDRWIEERTLDVRTLAVALSGHLHDNYQLRSRLSELLSFQSAFYAAGFAGPEGRVRVRTDYLPQENIADTSFFRSASGGSAVMADPYIEPNTGMSTLVFAAPVYRSGEELAGVLFAVSNVEKLQQLLHETSPGILSDTYLVNDAGIFITQPSNTSVFTNPFGGRYDPVLRANLDSRIFEAASSGERLTDSYSNYAGLTVYGDYRRINNGSWLLIGETLASRIHDRYSGFSSLLFLLLFVALALIFSVVINLSKTIASPLRALEREMNQVKEEGRSNVRPDWKIFEKAPVEIRSLAYSFHTMEEQLSNNLQALKEATITDDLTRLFNRRHLFEEGYRYVHMIRRTHIPLACLMLDIDHFKHINDTYGHAVGDQLLREVSRGMRESIRETDFAARYGGEGFVILAYRADRDQALQLAERLRSHIARQEHDTEAGKLSITISIGVSLLYEGKTAVGDRQHVKVVLDELLRIADNALYDAKDAGRNQVVFGGKINGK